MFIPVSVTLAHFHGHRDVVKVKMKIALARQQLTCVQTVFGCYIFISRFVHINTSVTFDGLAYLGEMFDTSSTLTNSFRLCFLTRCQRILKRKEKKEA